MSAPLACRLTPPEQSRRRVELETQVFAAALAIRELPDGWAARFEGDEWLARLAELIRFERGCCPFLHFALRAEPGDGAITLEITGPEGAKAFVAENLGLGVR